MSNIVPSTETHFFLGDGRGAAYLKGSAYCKFWALGGALIRSWALIRAFTLLRHLLLERVFSWFSMKDFREKIKSLKDGRGAAYLKGSAYCKFWALGGALIRSWALIWSWALIEHLRYSVTCFWKEYFFGFPWKIKSLAWTLARFLVFLRLK